MTPLTPYPLWPILILPLLSPFISSPLVPTCHPGPFFPPPLLPSLAAPASPSSLHSPSLFSTPHTFTRLTQCSVSLEHSTSWRSCSTLRRAFNCDCALRSCPLGNPCTGGSVEAAGFVDAPACIKHLSPLPSPLLRRFSWLFLFHDSIRDSPPAPAVLGRPEERAWAVVLSSRMFVSQPQKASYSTMPVESAMASYSLRASSGRRNWGGQTRGRQSCGQWAGH